MAETPSRSKRVELSSLGERNEGGKRRATRGTADEATKRRTWSEMRAP